MSSRQAPLSILFLAAAGLVIVSSDVNAAWPAGAQRTISAQMCTSLNPGYLCPFISDSKDYFGGDVVTVSADYDEVHVSGGAIYVYACRQSWTGGAATCGTPWATQTPGNWDLEMSGFNSLSGVSSPYDYFYVRIAPSGGEVISAFQGVAFAGS
jgi:hypothetical protein